MLKEGQGFAKGLAALKLLEQDRVMIGPPLGLIVIRIRGEKAHVVGMLGN
jgi:hypothetical protein